MYCVSKSFLENILKEDVPYLDLTTELLGIGDGVGEMSFKSRHPLVIAGSEEVTMMGDMLAIETVFSMPSSTSVEEGVVFLTLRGNVGCLHKLWKIALNVLEYASGIATYAKKLLDKGNGINKDFFVVATRKHFPNIKELALKGILSGGVYPHRLGLSETILVFDHHRTFIDGSLEDNLRRIKNLSPEKKVIIEAGTVEEALAFSEMTVDGLQIDKMPVGDLTKIVKRIKKKQPHILLIAAGGVAIDNIEAYAKTGVDGVATSAMYFGKPSDIKVEMKKI